MNKPGQLTAMISSTSIDLPTHRREVEKACLREGVFPIGMEHLPARDADAIRVSQEIVDKADIYIGIFAWRYGHKPEGHNISITEMEFNRAVERKIPILVFLIHKDHPLTIEMVETDKDAQKKLAELKERASKGRGRREFKSPEDLRGEVIHALSDLKQREQESSGEKAAPDFHPPNLIPKPSEPYIAHPYSLLQTKDVVGRQAELNLLTDWVTTNQQVPADTRIFNLVAIGGMGKSALTWKWFNDIAPNELPKLAGRLWWSFYESDAHWENFIIRALAYVSGQTEQAVREMKSPDREDQLWRILDQQPFLLVLDGLERTLLAYARMDAAQMLDDDLDEQTANRVAQAHGLLDSGDESFIGKHQLRCTADHRAGQYLRRLTRVRQSRILITTRLYPAELQTDMGDPLPGCFAPFFTGLKDDDALNLWREFKVTGSTEQLLPLFRSFRNYPLLLRALAGEVAAFRPAPRDFDKWREKHPQFNPAGLPLKNAKTHVLEFALCGLNETQHRVLSTIGAFRMPATWDTLRALLARCNRPIEVVGQTVLAGHICEATRKDRLVPCADERELDMALTELEDRGLVGWDRSSNRYDLHPIVRGVVWQALDRQSKMEIQSNRQNYFRSIHKPKDRHLVRSLEDLTPAIELFHTLVSLENYDEAYAVFDLYLLKGLQKLGVNRQRAEILEHFFPNGITAIPKLRSLRAQRSVVHDLAHAYRFRGEPGRAISLYEHEIELNRRNSRRDEGLVWGDLSRALGLVGHLRKSETVVFRALQIGRTEGNSFRETLYLRWVALSLAARGNNSDSKLAFKRCTETARKISRHPNPQILCSTKAHQAQLFIWLGRPTTALPLARQTFALASAGRQERDFIRGARLHGTAALGTNDFATASDRLEFALGRARAVNFVEEELPILTILAELRRHQQQPEDAKELLAQVWPLAERGPYRLFFSDALNVLAQIERDQGNRAAAIAAATKAHTLAWCDGPPYAYHYGLTNARKHLQELGAPEPQLPPFNESKFEPMPDVELNPKDEFWVDPDRLDSQS